MEFIEIRFFSCAPLGHRVVILEHCRIRARVSLGHALILGWAGAHLAFQVFWAALFESPLAGVFKHGLARAPLHSALFVLF